MDDHQFLDISQFLTEMKVVDPESDPRLSKMIENLRNTKPITIEIDFGENGIDRFRCRLCRTSFVIGPEGIPSLHHPRLGDIIACPKCIMKWIEP